MRLVPGFAAKAKFGALLWRQTMAGDQAIGSKSVAFNVTYNVAVYARHPGPPGENRNYTEMEKKYFKYVYVLGLLGHK
jgi:hypothetical protein